MATSDRRIVLVLGPGRSGTSTMAGALAHSGYRVPQAIKGNETNPSGFYEPRWVVDLHRELLGRTGVRTLDTDPAAFELMEQVTADKEVRDRARTWLEGRLDKLDRVVIKDPRLVWFRDLWVSVAQDLGLDPAFVVMLRHPSEVGSSRSEYYNAGEVTAVAGWVNVALLSERLTTGSPRALVHYPQLTTDWRSELTRMRELLGLELDPPPEQTPHPIDEFIDPGLRRMKSGWDGMSIPSYLQEIGDRTFDALGAIADTGVADEAALATLREEYARLHEDSHALVLSSIKRTRDDAQRTGARRARNRMRKQAQARAVATPGSAPGPAQRIKDGLSRRLGGGAGS